MSIKDYLHLYLGCKGRVSIDYGFPMRGMKIVDCVLIGIVGEIVTLECYDTHGNKWEAEHICHYGRFKPILRPLSDMTEEEAIELHRITTPHLVIDWPADKDKYDVSYLKDHMLTKEHPNYGYINAIQVVDLRAPHDYMNINDRWDILRYNHEEGAEPKINERVYHQPKAFAFLLSKHFDLFGLIDAGLAIDKSKEASK